MCDHAEYCLSCSMQGIYFYDITTLLLNTEAFHNVIDMLVERYEGRRVEAVAGVLLVRPPRMQHLALSQ